MEKDIWYSYLGWFRRFADSLIEHFDPISTISGFVGFHGAGRGDKMLK